MPSNLRTRSFAIAVVLTVIAGPYLAGCSSDNGGSITEPAGTLAVALSDGSAQVDQGGSTTVTVTVTRGGGFTGPVDLSVDGAPAGITGTFSPATVPGASSTSTLSISASGAAAPGTHGVTVRARAQGLADQTATLQLTVVELGGFTLAVSPETLDLMQGDGGSATVEIARSGGFNGAVSLSVTGASAGLTATIDPGTATGASATVHVAASAGLEPGSYTLTVAGTAEVAPGQTRDATASLVVEVVERPGAGWAQVSAGQHHTCALNEEGEAYCWGRNQFGQLGDGTTEPRSRARLVTGGHTWASVTAGLNHTCGITTAGDGYCWGHGGFGRLGNGSTANSSTPEPVAVSGGDTWASLSAGGEHTCGMTPDGRAYCWGRNSRGQLGEGTSTTRTTRVLVVDDHLWRVVSAGTSHTCGVTTNDEAYCWGERANGRLGNGASGLGAMRRPELVQGGHVWEHVAARSAHSCGIATNGESYCWGANNRGQLGVGDVADRTTPALIINDHEWRDLKPGVTNSTCGVEPSGTGYCWGFNGTGQVGDGTTGNKTAPQPVAGGIAWKGPLSGGDDHTCGVAANSDLYCWGRGSYGQLGNGSAATTVYREPVRVLDPL